MNILINDAESKDWKSPFLAVREVRLAPMASSQSCISSE